MPVFIPFCPTVYIGHVQLTTPVVSVAWQTVVDGQLCCPTTHISLSGSERKQRTCLCCHGQLTLNEFLSLLPTPLLIVPLTIFSCCTHFIACKSLKAKDFQRTFPNAAVNPLHSINIRSNQGLPSSSDPAVSFYLCQRRKGMSLTLPKCFVT